MTEKKNKLQLNYGTNLGFLDKKRYFLAICFSRYFAFCFSKLDQLSYFSKFWKIATYFGLAKIFLNSVQNIKFLAHNEPE
jgi:hypothetical protein